MTASCYHLASPLPHDNDLMKSMTPALLRALPSQPKIFGARLRGHLQPISRIPSQPSGTLCGGPPAYSPLLCLFPYKPIIMGLLPIVKAGKGDFNTYQSAA